MVLELAWSFADLSIQFWTLSRHLYADPLLHVIPALCSMFSSCISIPCIDKSPCTCLSAVSD